MKSYIDILLAAGVLSVGPAMAQSVTNTPTGGSIVFWGPSAIGGGQSYGEIFTAPNSELVDFSFIAADSGSSYPFVGQVYAWDGTETTGPALYTSGVVNTTSSLTSYTFTADTAVTTGDQYIAFITNQPGGASLGGSGTGSIQSGVGPATFEYAEGDPSAPGAWFAYGGNGAFNADFSAAGVPEPAAWALTLLGVGGLGLALRRKAASLRLA